MACAGERSKVPPGGGGGRKGGQKGGGGVVEWELGERGPGGRSWF